MTQSLETATLGAVRLALDAATLRHQAIATNIANAGTPNYQPLRVSFEEHLVAARAALRSRGSLDAAALIGMQPRLERDAPVADAPGTAQVAVDAQVAKLTENAVHYQALLRALNKQLAILSTAINDGKR